MNIVTSIIELSGGIQNLALSLNITTQSIYLWQRQGYIPAKRFQAIQNLHPTVEIKQLLLAYQNKACE